MAKRNKKLDYKKKIKEGYGSGNVGIPTMLTGTPKAQEIFKGKKYLLSTLFCRKIYNKISIEK